MNITYFHLADGDLIHDDRAGRGAKDGCVIRHYDGDDNKDPIRNKPYGSALGDMIGGGWVVQARRAPDALKNPNAWVYALMRNRMGNDGGCVKTLRQLTQDQIKLVGLSTLPV